MPIRARIPNRSKQDGFWKHWSLWVWFFVAIFFCVGAVVLWKSGRWLVHEDSFEKISWSVILAGESRDCERSDAALKLYQEGRIDTVVLSACRIFKNHYASEYMVDYMVTGGIPFRKVFEFRQDAFSTLEEAKLLIRQFRLQNLDTVLIITSNYHTARTSRIFRKLAQGYPVVLVFPAEYHTYDPEIWWSNRESMKYWLNEWLKTIYTFYEMLGKNSDISKADFNNLTPDIYLDHKDNSGSMPTVAPTSTSQSITPEPSVKMDSTVKNVTPTSPGDTLLTSKKSADLLDSSTGKKSVDTVGVKRKTDTESLKSESHSTKADSNKTKASATKLEPKSEVKTEVKTEVKRVFPRAETTKKKDAKKTGDKSKKKSN